MYLLAKPNEKPIFSRSGWIDTVDSVDFVFAVHIRLLDGHAAVPEL
jgi:hypothetical protein